MTRPNISSKYCGSCKHRDHCTELCDKVKALIGEPIDIQRGDMTIIPTQRIPEIYYMKYKARLRTTPNASNKSLIILLYFTDGITNKSEIARIVGVSKQYVSRITGIEEARRKRAKRKRSGK